MTWLLLSVLSCPFCREPCPAVSDRCRRCQWEHPAGKRGKLVWAKAGLAGPTWKGCSKAWLISFHRPPTCNKDWELKTVKWRPTEIVEFYISRLLTRKKNILPKFPIIFKLIWDYFKIRFMQFCASFMFILIMQGALLGLSHHQECWWSSCCRPPAGWSWVRSSQTSPRDGDHHSVFVSCQWRQCPPSPGCMRLSGFLWWEPASSSPLTGHCQPWTRPRPQSPW